MKIVQRTVYERGDHVEITRGYNKGMVGVVVSHDQDDRELNVLLASQAIKPRRPLYFSEDDNDNSMSFQEGAVKYITPDEYEAGVKANNLLRIEGLSEPIQYKKGRFTIGDNPITTASAKKLADFINKHAKTKAKK